MQDVDSCSKLGSFSIELAEAGDLPSQPPVIEVADVTLQMHKVTAGPDEEGVELGREQFDGVFLAMPIHVSLRIQINNIRGLIRALLLMEPSDLSVFQLFDPLGWFEDSITEGNVEVGHLPIVFDISIGGPLEYVFIMFNAVMESTDLLFEVANFSGLLGIASGNGVKEPFSDGSEDVRIEIGVGRQCSCNCIGRHRWFQALNQSDWERAVVFGGRDI